MSEASKIVIVDPCGRRIVTETYVGRDGVEHTLTHRLTRDQMRWFLTALARVVVA